MQVAVHSLGIRGSSDAKDNPLMKLVTQLKTIMRLRLLHHILRRRGNAKVQAVMSCAMVQVIIL